MTIRQTILSVIGTRPEVIKMAPVLQLLSNTPEMFRSIVCITGQHRSILDQMLQVFDIKPDFDLNVMSHNQSLSQLTARLLTKLNTVVREIKPDWILAQGDTTSVFAAALTAFYYKIPFGHIEAGLRTNDKYQPFPEEVNRKMVDMLADLCFAPTERAYKTLLKEGIPLSNIVLTGNTVVDALQHILSQDYDWNNGPLASLPHDKKLVVVTMHRRENFGAPLRDICRALRHIAETCRDKAIHLVCPVHPNPMVHKVVHTMLADVNNISLLAPLDYPSLLNLMKRSVLVLTDSGGIQEEAPCLGVPVLIMRETTERPEGIEAGCACLVGTSTESIVNKTCNILFDTKARSEKIVSVNPYGDGKAALRIVSALWDRKSR